MPSRFLLVGGIVVLSGALFFGFTSLAEDAPAGSLATLDPDNLITSDKKSFSAKDSLTFPLGVIVEAVLPSPSPLPIVEALTTVAPEPSVLPDPSVLQMPEVLIESTPEVVPTETPTDVPVASPLSFWRWLVSPVWAADAEPVAVDSVVAKILDAAGKELTVLPTITTVDGHAVVSISGPVDALSPGQYVLQVTAAKDGATLTTDHAFTWALTEHGVDPTLYSLPVMAEEVPSQRTEKTVTFKTGGRQYVAVGNLVPIFTGASGSLVPVEPYGKVKDSVVMFDKLPGAVRIQFKLDRPEYMLEQDGLSYVIAMHGGGPGLPAGRQGKIVDARTLEYPLADGATLRWRVIGNRVEKAITVAKAGVVPTLRFTVTPSAGLIVILEKNNLLLRDTKGEVKFTADEPFLTTASGGRLEQNVVLEQREDGSFGYVYNEDGLSFPYILDPSSGPNSPGTTDQASHGTVTWLTVSNITSSNDVYSQVSLAASELSYKLLGTNFGFSIPSDATIQGIVLEVERKTSSASNAAGARLQISGADAGGTQQGDTITDTSDAYKTLGSSSDTWNHSWTAGNINDSTFGFGYFANGNGSGLSIVSVDHGRMTVYYVDSSARQRMHIFD